MRIARAKQLGIKPKLSRPDEAALELVLGIPGRVLGCIITQRRCRAYRSGFRAQGRLHMTCHHKGTSRYERRVPISMRPPTSWSFKKNFKRWRQRGFHRNSPRAM